MTRQELRRRRHRRRVAVAGLFGLAVLGGIGWALLPGSSGPPARSREASATRARSLLPNRTPTTSPTTTTAAPGTTASEPVSTASEPVSTASVGPPYAVGVIQVTLLDPSRPGPARGATPASAARQLPVTIHYPARGTPGSGDVADAAASPGTFPLVVFAHGFDVSASTYAALEHELAAGGFVAAAPDFPLSSSAFPGPPVETDIVDQAHDVSFLITSLRSGAGLGAVLLGHLAPTSVGIVGHSDGGTTVAEAADNSCCTDARIGAAAVLSGDEGHGGGQWFATGGPPLLVVQGTVDDINPPPLSQKLFEDATASKLYVTITGGAHLAPYTSGPQRGAISTLLVDFLRAELEGDHVLTKVLADANVPGMLTLAASAP